MKALKKAYPSLKMQGCIVYKLRSVATKLKRVHLKPCMAEAKGIFHAPGRREAIKHLKTWKEKWQVEEERAVRCLEKDFYHCLHYYSFPKEWWEKIRTTNALERAFREVRRRTRPMSCFQNSASVDRIIFGVISRLNSAWKAKPLPGFTHNS